LLYRNVCLEGFACTLPAEVVSSADLEARLEPLYRRLRLPEGRLELMTGIAQRRFWPRGTRPSEKSAETAEKPLEQSGVDRRHIGALVHASVCRDQLEPATACAVHRQLGLSHHCSVHDLSNACLGLLNGIVDVANRIELGQIRAGLVVGTESSRALVESTIARLNADQALTRQDVKMVVASLTIGSGSAAVLLTDRRLSQTGNRLLGGIARAYSEHHKLCCGGDLVDDDAAAPLMWTDSEALMHEGIRAARDTFAEFCRKLDWQPDQIDKIFCHQVGRAHRKLMLESLGLEPAIDFSTLEWLGNTGSVALPMTAALGIEQGHLCPNDRVALMGIGSGINVLILALDWQRSLNCPPETAASTPLAAADFQSLDAAPATLVPAAPREPS